MTDAMAEMVHVLEDVGKVNRHVVLPMLRSKGVRIIDSGTDFGAVQTNLDVGTSEALLGGNQAIEIHGLRSRYPGSFSEENDSGSRRSELELYEVDPIDGSGDLLKTQNEAKVIGPTILVSRLARKNVGHCFRPVAGLIFDVLHQYAMLAGDGNKGLYRIDGEGRVRDVPFVIEPHEALRDGEVRINRRRSYPQHNFYVEFMEYLRKNWHDVVQVDVGGAGTCALHLFRGFVQPTDGSVPHYESLEPLSILFNAQPDWKTWDTDPTDAIAEYIGFPAAVDVYGSRLVANAASHSFVDMYHTKGYVLSPDEEFIGAMTQLSREFYRRTGLSILEKDY